MSRRKSRTSRRKRVGPVSYYWHHGAWYLYHREGMHPVRRRGGTNELAAAQLAAQLNADWTRGVASPLSFEPLSVPELRRRFLDHHENAIRSSLATVNCYRTATSCLERFAAQSVESAAHEIHADVMLRWLRTLRVAPNGHSHSSERSHCEKGIRFVLENCRALYTFCGQTAAYALPRGTLSGVLSRGRSDRICFCCRCIPSLKPADQASPEPENRLWTSTTNRTYAEFFGNPSRVWNTYGMQESDGEVDAIVSRASSGDIDALGLAFQHFRNRLKQAVRMRLDPRISGRIDPSDVVQEAFLDASRRLPEYVASKDMPLFLWFRLLTNQRLADLHRQHFQAEMRDIAREFQFAPRGHIQTSSLWLTKQFVDRRETPVNAAIRIEFQQKIQQMFEQMEPLDREVLAMRHFEMLSNNEISQILGITKAAASNRYIRALKRLKASIDLSGEEPQ